MWDDRKRAVMDWLLNPFTLEEFERSYYEQQPLHVSRNQPGYYRDVFSLSEVERILGEERSGYFISVFKDGARSRADGFVRKDDRDEGRGSFRHSALIVDPHRLATLFGQGFTIVCDHLGQCSPPVSKLMRKIEGFLGHKIDCTFFLTPPRSTGLRAHWDPSDTWVLQIEGRKRWRLSRPVTDLPLQQHNGEPPGEFLCDVQLEPGDFLYVPRGVFHQSFAEDDVHSLHVAFGVYPVLLIDVLERALSRAAKEHVHLRRSAHLALGERNEIDAILSAAFSPENLKAAFEEGNAKFKAGVPYQRTDDTEGLLRQVLSAPSVTPKSFVAFRPEACFHVLEQENKTVVAFAGNELSFPKSAAAVIAQMLAVDRIRIEELSTSTPEAPAVVRRLVQAGLAVWLGDPAVPPATNGHIAAAPAAGVT